MVNREEVMLDDSIHNKNVQVKTVSSQIRFFTDSSIQERDVMMVDILHTEAAIANVLQNSCSKKFRKFHRKTPVLESLFDKVVSLKAHKFIKNRL